MKLESNRLDLVEPNICGIGIWEPVLDLIQIKFIQSNFGLIWIGLFCNSKLLVGNLNSLSSFSYFLMTKNILRRNKTQSIYNFENKNLRRKRRDGDRPIPIIEGHPMSQIVRLKFTFIKTKIKS